MSGCNINGLYYKVVEETESGLWKLQFHEGGRNFEVRKCHVTGPTFPVDFPSLQLRVRTYCPIDRNDISVSAASTASDEGVEWSDVEEQVEATGAFTPRMFRSRYEPLLAKIKAPIALGYGTDTGIDDWASAYIRRENHQAARVLQIFTDNVYGQKHKYTKRDMAMVLYAPGNVIAFVSKQNPLAKGSATFWNVIRHIIVVDPLVEELYQIHEVKTFMDITRNSGNTFSHLPPKLRSLAEDVYNLIAV